MRSLHFETAQSCTEQRSLSVASTRSGYRLRAASLDLQISSTSRRGTRAYRLSTRNLRTKLQLGNGSSAAR